MWKDQSRMREPESYATMMPPSHQNSRRRLSRCLLKAWFESREAINFLAPVQILSQWFLEFCACCQCLISHPRCLLMKLRAIDYLSCKDQDGFSYKPVYVLGCGCAPCSSSAARIRTLLLPLVVSPTLTKCFLIPCLHLYYNITAWIPCSISNGKPFWKQKE